MTMRFITARRLALPVLMVAGCTADPNPVDPPGTTKPITQLAVVKLPQAAPPLFNDSVAFYSKAGRNDEGFLYFRTAAGGRGEKFARIRIRQNSLFAQPNGTPYGPHDSVLVVMKVANPGEFSVELLPSGIRFNVQEPAELRIEYEATNGDLNGDGRTDSDDDAIERRMALWRQEEPGDPLVKIGTVKTEGLRELKADLTSFSRYFIAY